MYEYKIKLLTVYYSNKSKYKLLDRTGPVRSVQYKKIHYMYSYVILT